MARPRGYYGKVNTSDGERQTLYDFNYKRNKNVTKQDRSKPTEMEHKLEVAKGEEGRMDEK